MARRVRRKAINRSSMPGRGQRGGPVKGSPGDPVRTLTAVVETLLATVKILAAEVGTLAADVDGLKRAPRRMAPARRSREKTARPAVLGEAQGEPQRQARKPSAAKA